MRMSDPGLIIGSLYLASIIVHAIINKNLHLLDRLTNHSTFAHYGMSCVGRNLSIGRREELTLLLQSFFEPVSKLPIQ